MKAFHFPLDPALAWRRRREQAEEAAWQRALGEVRALEREIERLQLQRETEARALLAAPAGGSELGRHAAWAAAATHRGQRLGERLQASRRDAAAQQERWREARRQVELLEQLRARRRSEWSSEAQRELETLAAESHLARWVRESG